MKEDLKMKNSQEKNTMVVGILPCSGSCNVGMMSVKSTVSIVEEGEDIQYVCALGLPLKIKSIVDKARMADKYIALNGCEVSCATKALHSVDVKPDKEYCIIRDFPIKKTGDFKDEKNLEDIIVSLRQTVKQLKKLYWR